MSNGKFISAINDRLSQVASKYTGSRVFGLAQSISRPVSEGLQTMPAIVSQDGEEKYVGLDDSAPLTIYHRANSISVSDKTNSGYGDARSFKVYLYSNVMIVFMDRAITRMLPDEFILFMEANIQDQLLIENYRSVIVRIQNIILNSAQVFNSEYQNVSFRMSPRFSLFAINYQIESVFDKNCFATCP